MICSFLRNAASVNRLLKT